MRGYPVYIDGAECGVLNIYQDGLRTVFDARCSSGKGGVIRLNAYGEGRSFPLGVMKRDGESLSLRRVFTKSELRTLPSRVDYAADAERARPEEEAGDIIWRRAPNGCLVSDKLLAIPAAPALLGKLAPRLRDIDGRCYLIFKRKLR